MEENKITEKIIGICFEIYNQLGPGFPEKIYHNALEIAFKDKDIKATSEKNFPVHYGEKEVGYFKVDFLVEDRVILEIKSIAGKVPKIFESQIISYLKASGVQAGLLVNFGDESCKVRRMNLTSKLS